jgi:hypothetical protein
VIRGRKNDCARWNRENYVNIEQMIIQSGGTMSTDLTPTAEKHPKPMVMRHGGGSDAVYGIGLIGAWVYYSGAPQPSDRASRGSSKASSGRLFWFTSCSLS